MATTRLNPSSSARCPEGRLTVDWRLDGGSTDAYLVTVVPVAMPGRPAVAVSQTGAEQLLISTLPEAVEVVVRCPGGTFPNGLGISAQLTLRIGDTEVDRYILPRADISGTSGATLVVLSPHAGFWQIDIPADLVRQTGPPEGEGPPGPTSGVPQVGLAQEAAYAARRSAGVARLPQHRRSELHLAVDRSASLLPLVRDGSGQALLELLLGVNGVAGSQPDVALWSLDSLPRSVPAGLTPANVDGRWVGAFGAQAQTGGTLLAPLVAATHTPTGARTVVVLTDGVPADLDELRAALGTARAEGSRTRWHLLALARSAGDPGVQLEPWRDELQPLAPLVADGLLSCSALSPELSPGWLVTRLTEPRDLRRAIDALPFWSPS